MKSKSTDNAKVSSLKGVEPDLMKRIMDEVLEDTPSVKWEDIAGQEVCYFWPKNTGWYVLHFGSASNVLLIKLKSWDIL